MSDVHVTGPSSSHRLRDAMERIHPSLYIEGVVPSLRTRHTGIEGLQYSTKHRIICMLCILTSEIFVVQWKIKCNHRKSKFAKRQNADILHKFTILYPVENQWSSSY